MLLAYVYGEEMWGDGEMVERVIRVKLCLYDSIQCEAYYRMVYLSLCSQARVSLRAWEAKRMVQTERVWWTLFYPNLFPHVQQT